MQNLARKVVFNSISGYSTEHDQLLFDLIESKVLLFCAVGKDCELWHDIMDEIYVGNGEEKDFFMVTSLHPGETLDEVIDFAKAFALDDHEGDENVEVIEI